MSSCNWHNLNSRIPVMCFDHHLAHAASAFYPSGFERATIVTWDCWGDHLSGLIAHGEESRITVLEEVPYETLFPSASSTTLCTTSCGPAKRAT